MNARRRDLPAWHVSARVSANLGLALMVVTACAIWPPPDVLSRKQASRRELPPGALAPLFSGLGDYSYAISTHSELAQRYFNQGLILAYGFNHAEAVRSFREASRLDPWCAMCFWGEAYALGPNINKPMDRAAVPAAWEALQKALRTAYEVSAKERALIEALAWRYAREPVANRTPVDRAYADAMREVAREFPLDLDIQVLFAEALMDTMPWDYYLEDGEPKPETVDVITTLESVLERNPNHPGALHFYIHAVEPSDTPGRAEGAADRLRDLVPGAGHLVHMPAHIYLRVGRYADAVAANEKAIEADEAYISQCRAQGFYPATYYPHNIHFLWAAASFAGRSETAIAAAEKLLAEITAEKVRDSPQLEELAPTHLVALARFGRWGEILEQPRPPGEWRYASAMWRYARGLAFAAQGRIAEGSAALDRLRALREELTQEELVFASEATPVQLLEIAGDVLGARIAGAHGDWRAAIEHLKQAVAIQDALPYAEPPAWYFPVREAMGEALLRAGAAAEAEAVYREQLEKTPGYGWALHGLAESLRAQGREVEAAEAQREFEAAWEVADIPAPVSIF